MATFHSLKALTVHHRPTFGILALALLPACSAFALTLSSPAFENGGPIPNAFTYSRAGQCSGANQSPPLLFSQVPAGTKSLAITVVDLDGNNFVHWKAWNIAGTITALATNAAASPNFSQSSNDFGTLGYGGPCPPTANHRYIFTLYALDRSFPVEPSLAQLGETALARATLAGVRSPSDNLGWTRPSLQTCLFNWVERQLPEFVAPRNPVTLQAAPFTFRYYSETESYFGFSSEDEHMYFVSASTGAVDLGSASAFAPTAACR